MKKKVLFLSLWYPNKADSMLGLFVRKQAIALSDIYDVSVVSAVGVSKSNDIGLQCELYDDKIREIIVYFKNSSWKILQLFRFLMAYVRGYRYYCKELGRPELIHANILTRVGLIAYFINKLHGIQYVVSEHWSRYYPENFSYKGCLRKWFTNKVVANARFIIVPSNRIQAAMIQQNIKGNYIVIPNVIDTDLFTIESVNVKNGTKRFVHISCFEDKSKNISMLFHAIALLKDKRTDFELIMIGEGQDRRHMEDLSTTLGIDDVVTFAGQLEGEELAGVVRKSDCCVLSSRYETFAIVVYEALACGVPVVATDVADIKKHIDKQFGIVTKSHNADDFAQAMEAMLNTCSEFNPFELRNFIVHNFSSEQVANQINTIYIQCLSDSAMIP